MKRTKKYVAMVIILILIVSIINPRYVSASQIPLIKNRIFNSNILSPKWDSMFGLKRADKFNYEKGSYCSKDTSNAAMQQVIELKQYEELIDSKGLFFGISLDAISNTDSSLFICIDFYNEKPSEDNYKSCPITNRTIKTVEPTKGMFTSLSYNILDDGRVGDESEEYIIPYGARYARISIRAHSNSHGSSTVNELDLMLYNINFGVSKLKKNETYNTKTSFDRSVIRKQDNPDELINVNNVTKGWSPTAKLQIDILSDLVKEVVLPNGVTTQESTSYYITKNGEYKFNVIMKNGVKTEKNILVSNIDNSSSQLEVNYNQGNYYDEIIIVATDNQSGVKNISYAWNDKTTKPLKYQLFSDYIQSKTEVGIWFLHIKVEDFAGNVTQYCSDEIVVEAVLKKPIIETDLVRELPVDYEGNSDAHKEVAKLQFDTKYLIIENSSIMDVAAISVETTILLVKQIVGYNIMTYKDTGPPGTFNNGTLL